MGNFNKKFISKEEFEHLIHAQQLYEGYVIGVGYAYCETYTIAPNHLNGDFNYSKERTKIYTHYILTTHQCIDSSPDEVLRSLRLSYNNFSDVLVKKTTGGTMVNIGNGDNLFIPLDVNHKIDIEIEDSGYGLWFRINVENFDTGESKQTKCMMRDFANIFNTYPNIPSSSSEISYSEKVQGVGQPELLESLGSGRAAADHFQNGNYWQGALYTVLAVSDVFLIKAIATGLLKGAFKIAGSHSWSASRKWMLNKGWAKANEPLHHWAISQSFAKKYNIEAIANQPWNMVRFVNQSFHMRAGHGMRYLGEEGFGAFGRFWYGTPTWFKATGTSTIGRGVLLPLDRGLSDYAEQYMPD